MQALKHILTLVLAIVMTSAGAAAQTYTRPIEDFLDAQGTMVTFVPPVPDYIGWVDGDFINFALVDYAGLAADFIEAATGRSLSTTVTGSVTEKVLEDGRLEVHIQLETMNALAWAFEIADADFDNDPFPFLNTPLAFGHRAQDVVNEGAEPALAKVSLKVEFIHIADPGGPLPDLVQLLFDPKPDQVVTLIDFQATADGPLHEAFGVSEGTPGRLEVEQECESEGEGNPCAFKKEIVDILVEGD